MSLEKSVSNKEIKKALFDMAPLKALGSDGFHVLFFQNQWDTLGSVVCQWVQGDFASNNSDPELNNTLLVLLPKADNPETFTQFRPISLYSILYKLVVKPKMSQRRAQNPKPSH
ncbi:hypothetical protein J1N35_017668 [Gossypium stocksii]|uniref:Reverse transcriptase domain-containing protein n=1 Tax=Gossypium stocksii TaxID=47602 RepID=A0A9D3VMI3_9ROSI|nr:hypothetical protein J1N35_017668 [Gossypium stocksii]